MSSRSKGRQRELKAKTKLEKDGYIVEIVRGSSRFAKSVDFFGLFDLIAIKEGSVLLVQVKSQKVSLKPYQEFIDKHGAINIFAELWVYQKRKPFKKYLILPSKIVNIDKNS